MTGNDSNTCDSPFFAHCQTLRHAVNLAEDGDSIYLDGRGTEKNPYGCEKPTTLPTKISEFINKSLAIIGLFQRAYLSCDHGLQFHTPEGIKKLNVVFNRLSFVRTGVRFEGNCAVFIVNSTFSNYSSAVDIIGRYIELFLRMSVFTNNTFCLTLIQMSVKQPGHVLMDISDVLFKKNQIQESMIHVKNQYGLTSVQVSNSVFEENHSKYNDTFLFTILTMQRSIGDLRVVNSSFVLNPNGILVLGRLNMYFHNVTFTTINTALRLFPYVYNSPAEIILTDSTFFNSSISLDLKLVSALKANITVKIRNTTFSRSKSEQAQVIIANARERSSSKFYSSHQISLHNVTFHSVKGFALLLSFPDERYITIDIENTVFLNNNNTEGFSRDGVILHMELPLDVFDCKNRTTSFKSHVNFRNTKFEGNRGYSAIVYVRNGRSSFENCFFTENYVMSTIGGVLCQGDGTGSLSIRNSTFLQRTKLLPDISQKSNKLTSFIYSESEGALMINMSIFATEETRNFEPIISVIKGNYVNLDLSSSIICPFGTTIRFFHASQLKIPSVYRSVCLKKGTTFQVFCDDCPLGTYSLERGHST